LDLTLTFDNGPEPETTPFVLDVLARRSIRTTFFVVGNKLSTPEGRELARRAHEEGHWIGNHTWSHSVPLGILKDPSAIGAEIRDTQEAIGALAHPHRFFRPFGQGGNLDERLLNLLVVDVLSAQRMSCVLWNAIPGDWKEPDGWVDRALAQCRLQAWTVMVLHEVPPAPDARAFGPIAAHSNRVSADCGLRCRETGFSGQRKKRQYVSRTTDR
jgi:peptidoglycan/xylan/chitin deacetylase (PgdA/CDA1 family)